MTLANKTIKPTTLLGLNAPNSFNSASQCHLQAYPSLQGLHAVAGRAIPRPVLAAFFNRNAIIADSHKTTSANSIFFGIGLAPVPGMEASNPTLAPVKKNSGTGAKNERTAHANEKLSRTRPHRSRRTGRMPNRRDTQNRSGGNIFRQFFGQHTVACPAHGQGENRIYSAAVDYRQTCPAQTAGRICNMAGDVLGRPYAYTEIFKKSW